MKPLRGVKNNVPWCSRLSTVLFKAILDSLHAGTLGAKHGSVYQKSIKVL